MAVWLLLVVAGIASAQMSSIHEEKTWSISSCGGSESVQVDVAMGFGYISTPQLNVLVDYNTRETAFNFLGSSRCLVTPLNTDVFADKPDELEMNAALMSFQHGAVDSSTFKKYKVVQTSDSIDPNTHFNQKPELVKIQSDLIVEYCEDAKSIATASIQLIGDSDDECTSLDHFHCVIKNKICESPK